MPSKSVREAFGAARPHMHYDPVKDRLEAVVKRFPALRWWLYLALRSVFLREREVRAALRRLAASGFRPRTILDAGTGLGQYTLFLRRLFPEAEILSVDIKQAYIESMRHYCDGRGITGIRFELEDLTRMEREEEFDLILNVDVIEHIVEDEVVLLNFSRALKPDGVLVLHTPSVAEGVSDDEVEFSQFSVGEHVRQGDKPSTMSSLLRSRDFDSVEIHPTYGVLGELARQLLVRVPMRLLSFSFWLAPIVALWMGGSFLVASAMNMLDARIPKRSGESLLATARRPAARACEEAQRTELSAVA